MSEHRSGRRAPTSESVGRGLGVVSCDAVRAVRVVEHMPSWLDRGETWLWQQLRAIDDEVDLYIAADRRMNDDAYPIRASEIQVLRDLGALRFAHEKAMRRLGLRMPGALFSLVRRIAPDVLHSHFGPMGWIASRHARAIGIPHIVTFYGYDVNHLPQSSPKWRKRYLHLFDDLSAVLCEGPYMAAQIVALGAEPGKVRVQRLGVPIEDLEFRPRSPHGGPLRLLVAASFREKKGVPYAVEAASAFAAHHPVLLTIIGASDGSGSSRAEEKRIADAVSRARCEVRMIGSVPHARLVQEMYEHDVLLAPSVTASNGDTEGGAPVTVIEAAATGMPIVATNHCDIPDVLQAAAHLLGPERDVVALVDRLGWLLENPWADLLLRVRRHTEVEHNADVQGKKLAAVYRALSVGR